MLNKKIVAALSLTISSLGFAGTMGPVCVPGDVTVPCGMKQWDFGIQALYLKPTYRIEQGTLSPEIPAVLTLTDGLSNSATAASLEDMGGKWSMAFALQGSYHFSTGNDISMDWTHYDATQNREHLNLSQSTRFDQANFVFGQHIDFDQIKSARFYGGLQYANLHISRINSIAVATEINLTINQTHTLFYKQQNYADYNGFGPVLGVDFAYAIGSSGFSLTANTATSVLYGTGRANINTTPSVGNLVIAHPYNARKMMAPGIEEKLGLNYNTQFAQGQLSINGGYQALNYFNVVSRAQLPRTALSDFGMYGPYFGVRWLGVA